MNKTVNLRGTLELKKGGGKVPLSLSLPKRERST